MFSDFPGDAKHRVVYVLIIYYLCKKTLDRAFTYRVFGLHVVSGFEIPELFTAASGEPDVTVDFGMVPDELPDYKGRGVLYQAKPGAFLFRLDTVGKYLVEDGRKITVEGLIMPPMRRSGCSCLDRLSEHLFISADCWLFMAAQS